MSDRPARPELAARVTFVTGELADENRGDRIWRTLGRPVLQKPFDFAQLEHQTELAVASLAGGAAVVPPGAERRAGKMPSS